MDDLPKGYDPKQVEDKWYAFWEEKEFFKASATSDKPPYSIVIPPPNVTGVLHMGHALVDTLQDTLIRWKRMCGYEALWVPGTDHAGIATQTVVERHLMATEGKRRADFTRETFVQRVWAWKEESEKHILAQLRKLGCSCDWSRLSFTMDEQRSLAVRTLFKKMFDDGLIVRDNYLVNWDPVAQTALADDEVEHEERDSHLWVFRYPLEGASGSIAIATTRPETLLGDVAIAVSPKDERYLHLVGKRALLPLMNRSIPIIADSHVDPEFGTGAVKITPAHDFNDYEMAQRHALPLINILTPDGKINDNGGVFQGMTREEARGAVATAMKEQGLLEAIIPHRHRVGISYRSKAVIEPYLSKQWFVRMAPFKDKLIRAVREGQVKLIPPHWENTYFHWIENLRDWCISRQLWWGHRIPIWYRGEEMICAIDAPPAGDGWKQDEDVLDTWFSSALWPFSLFGWPTQTQDLKTFYPTATLITGHDILFFWVARMILMGEYAMGSPPFPETFLHGLIYGKSYWRQRDDGTIQYASPKERLSYDLGEKVPSDVHSKWEKMSKSKGNVIDPLEIIEAYGTDALRMALCASATQARQIDLDRRRFEEFKNFANKIWNGARFVLSNLEGLSLSAQLDRSLLTIEDRWILSVLGRTVKNVNEALGAYAFDKASLLSYEFFWKEFCAYYVELSKPVLFGKRGAPQEKQNKQLLLLSVLLCSIRLMHPMAPFITEELFQLLKRRFPSPRFSGGFLLDEACKALGAPACIVAPYPQLDLPVDDESEEAFLFLDEIVHAVRNIRAEMQIPPGIATDLIIVGKRSPLISQNEGFIHALVRIGTLTWSEKEPQLIFSAHAFVRELKLIVPLPEELKEKEKLRLAKEQQRMIAQENQLRQQLANEEFLQKAPPQLVDKLKQTLEQVEKDLVEMTRQLGRF